MPFNCDQLKQEDIQKIMATMLLEFPVSQIDFYTPKWFDLLPEEGEIKAAVADTAREYLMNVRHLKDVRPMQENGEYERRESHLSSGDRSEILL